MNHFRLGSCLSAAIFSVTAILGILTSGYRSLADEIIVPVKPCANCQILSDAGNDCKNPGKCGSLDCESCVCQLNLDDPTGVSCQKKPKKPE